MDLIQLGKQIRTSRTELGLTQADLADKINVTWEMISRYERGESSPINKLEVLSNALNIPLLQLLKSAYNLMRISEGKTTPIPLVEKFPINLGETSKLYNVPQWIHEIDQEIFCINGDLVGSPSQYIFIAPDYPLTKEELVLTEKGELQHSSETTAAMHGVVVFQASKSIFY